MRVSPRRSVLASIAAGCCLAASVIAGGYAASGAMPFSEWPGAIFSSGGAAEVALAPATRAAAPVLTLPASTAKPQTKTEVIPLGDARPAGAGTTPAAATTPARRTATTLPGSKRRAPKADDVPDTSPTTAPTPTTQAPAPSAAPAAEPAPVQAAAPVAQAATRKVRLGSVTSTFANAQDSGSGQPELRVQMAVADATDTQTTAATTRTVSLSLKLAPTDVAALVRSAQAINASNIALETQVDVVDATVTSAGQPACVDGQCLRVQMRFAPDTRENPADGPEVQLLDDGDAISNRVKVVVKIDTDDLGTNPTTPSADPAPQDGAPSVMSLPLPPAADPASPPATPTTDTATVSLPDNDPAAGAPDAPAVQVQAQLEVVDTPAPEAPAPTTTPTTPEPAPAPAPDPSTGTTATTAQAAPAASAASAADQPAAAPVTTPPTAGDDCK
jgi:hypothetical protein